MCTLVELEAQLNDFDPAIRRRAIGALAAQHAAALPPAGANVNLHMHSFFSFHARDYSPSRLAWECRKAGLYAAGLCDFDVLDGQEEFLEAGLRLGLRATANLETRAFFPEYADVEISSPGEPGVTYIMGAGFARVPADGSPQAAGLAGYRQRASARNRALVKRINARLPRLAVGYDEDVAPLTPGGNVTERHIVRAYVAKILCGDAGADRLATLLPCSPAEAETLMNNRGALEERVRNRLVKRGGIGYEQPSVDTFPPVQEFVDWVLSCEAVPMITWLDGTSPAERDGVTMLECLIRKGAAALNIIPDRNWNIVSAAERKAKQAHLRSVIDAAEALRLPINIGTEMNREGLPFVDDLDGDALRPYREIFLRGARILVGHSLLLRYAGYSYVGPRAQTDFAALDDKNRFFEAIGALPPLSPERARELTAEGPDAALRWFRQACPG